MKKLKKAISYYRVSTDRQGQSGLGLEAQKQAVQAFAASHGLQIIKAFTEVESGRNNKRPLIKEALAACKKEKAVLVIARLDRLARNVAFISKLMESKVEFMAIDVPHADKFIVHIMAAVAEHARDRISMDTKTALQAAKERGVELGKYGKQVLSKRNKEAADRFARELEPIITKLKQQGIKSVRKLSDELNRLKIPTFRGGAHQWFPHTVHSVLKRIKGFENNNIQ